MRSSSTTGTGLFLAALVLGCGPSVDMDQPDATTATTAATEGLTSAGPTSTSTVGPSTSSGDTTSAAADTTAGDTTEGDPSETNGFISQDCGSAAPPGTLHHCTSIPTSCDPVVQDCPEGEKCNPWSDRGAQVWTATRCVPIANAPAGLGEPCVVEGTGWSGIDDCDVSLFCVTDGPDSTDGTCWSLCLPPTDAPTCPGAATCQDLGYGGEDFPICTELCDPLLQDCAAGQCDWNAVDQAFACFPAPAGVGQPGDPCEVPLGCVAGATCVDAQDYPGCVAGRCCTSLCDLGEGEPSSYCPPGELCVASPEAFPPEFAHVGSCVPP